MPYVLLVGNNSIILHSENNTFTMTCGGCKLTNYSKHSVMILQQHAFVMVPVSISKHWFDDKGLIGN